MVTRVPQADRALVDLAEALRLPNFGEPALRERWLDALFCIEDQPAAGDLAGRRLHPTGAGW